MDDDELIASVASGDDTALRELFSRHAPWLAARLRTQLSPADVEDVLQETFFAVWRGAGGYRPGTDPGHAGGWLWGIARRQAALLLRRGRPWLLVPDASLDRVPVAGDVADAAAIRLDLARAVSELGAPGGPEREAWRLLYTEDRPVAEVAALLGIPEGTVKSRAHRARRMLRAALRPAREGGAR
jgi:RNA polymerase sigma-70 factor, ECF subfamily